MILNYKIEKYLKHLRKESSEVNQDQMLPITNLMYNFYKNRPDLQNAFDLNFAEDRERFIHWFGNHGFKENFSLNQGSDFWTTDNCKTGVNVIGFVRSELGMGEDARTVSLSLANLGYPVKVHDLIYPSGRPAEINTVDHLISKSLSHKINIFCLPGTEQHRIFIAFGPSLFVSRYNIGYWPWELTSWPETLNHCFNLVDEIWAISEFVKETYEKTSPVPVFHMPLCITMPEVKERSRTYFRLPENKFLFLFIMDCNSTLNRKNPYAVIEAFNKSFSPYDDKVGLVIKSMSGEEGNPEWQKLLKLTLNDSRIRIINEVLPADDLNSLIKISNCFVSLHRAEGFGRCIAEAMLLEKPVIATNFSGNLDFCKKNNSCLVDYELIPVMPGEYLFADGNQQWADPIVDHAAYYMKKLVNDPVYARTLAIEGRKQIENNLGLEATGRRLVERLEKIAEKCRINA